MRTETRPWGRFEVIYEDSQTWLKRIIIAPGQSLSYQYHLRRTEYWVPEAPGIRAVVNGHDIELMYPVIHPLEIPPRVKHGLYNPGTSEVSLLEWVVGVREQPTEADIVRINDRYGRVSDA
jgi:mannose-6-phosphate isomerase-like protein (cupin superfamily)